MRVWILLPAAAALAGCATITKGTTQVVSVNTPGVTGATCTLTSSTIGSMTVVTPATVDLTKGGDNISVRCVKECYQDGVGILSSNLEGMAAGNLIFGGVIGLGVDYASGAMNKYSPEVSIAMAAESSCRAAPPPPRRGTIPRRQSA